MKKIATIIILVACSSITKAQLSDYKGALGLEFGYPKDSIKSMMQSKHPEAVKNQEFPIALEYVGGDWALYDIVNWVFQLTHEDELHTIRIKIDVGQDFQVWNKYEEVSKLFIEKYGNPQYDAKDWRSPYTIDDKEAYGISALKNGKVFYYRTWIKQNDPKNKEDYNTIKVEITTDAKIYVSYQNVPLLEKALKELKEKRKGEM